MPIASASSSNGITTATGPKISSRAARSVFATGASTTGANQKPAPSGARPRMATRAPSSTYDETFDLWSAEMSGPISVCSSRGSPTLSAFTDFGRPCERDLRDVGVLHEALADQASRADDDVQNALWQAGLEGDLAELDRRQRRQPGGLQHDRVPRREGGRHLPRSDRQREVP